ncbi:ribonuclease h2 subunit a [Anaeramoeba ignava]|uniref:Ribonuclease n=1 Tax=Anaeramoeba ignava TaxID=1746090 RepID=A0A9Q0LBW2_ANAIG|nr:ribonuclease h2 subunit a [Anaeramoeba ignava]
MEKKFCIGIDEAGRGCVLGSMIYSSCVCPKNKKKSLKKYGVDDSKKLTRKKRNEIFNTLKTKKYVEFGIKVISSEEISMKMLRNEPENLNLISHKAAINLIKFATKKFNIAEVYVDTVGPAKKYKQLLKKNFPKIPKIVVEEKADSKYPLVSAASICAKVHRDDMLENWIFKEININIDRAFGLGYTSESAVTNWMKKNSDFVFGFPTIIRFSWKTTILFMQKNCAKINLKKKQEKIKIKKTNKKSIRGKRKRSPNSSQLSQNSIEKGNLNTTFFIKRGISSTKINDL